ncbi:MAG: FG-GAP repeat domain-containing protein [Bacillota bacterium]
MKMNRGMAWLVVIVAVLGMARRGEAYIEAAYSLGRMIQESTNVVVVRVEKVDKEKNLILYRKVQDLKGKHPTDIIRHNIGTNGFSPREWQTIMNETEVGRIAVFFHNGSASETCINNYWYQCYPGGDWWRLIHGEPYLLRTYAGKAEKLIPAVQAILAGQEVIVPCMADGDKNALSLRSGKMQRMRASMKLQDYNPARDFAGWGQQEFQTIDSMPGFSHLGTISRVDPGAVGIVAADVDGNGRMGLCVYGRTKVVVLHPDGNTMEEVAIPYTGGATAAAWGDCNGDGKPDLLLATVSGPRLLVNQGGKFVDESARLPRETYYNLTAAAWIDADGDGKQDILLANGYLGLRLYRNRVSPPTTAPTADKATWFEDVSAKVGLGTEGVGARMKGNQLAVADVNKDGRMDFVYGAGMLVMNTPGGFVEAKDSGLAVEGGRGKAVFGDWDGDGFMDLYVTGAGKLYRNDGKGRFADVTGKSGDLASAMGNVTCAMWVDLGKKGKPDLMVGCVKGPNRYFRNKGDGTFVDAGEEVGFYQRVFNTQAMCAFDMNKDGVADLAFNNEGQESVVLLGAGK